MHVDVCVDAGRRCDQLVSFMCGADGGVQLTRLNLNDKMNRIARTRHRSPTLRGPNSNFSGEARHMGPTPTQGGEGALLTSSTSPDNSVHFAPAAAVSSSLSSVSPSHGCAAWIMRWQLAQSSAKSSSRVFAFSVRVLTGLV